MSLALQNSGLVPLRFKYLSGCLVSVSYLSNRRKRRTKSGHHSAFLLCTWMNLSQIRDRRIRPGQMQIILLSYIDVSSSTSRRSFRTSSRARVFRTLRRAYRGGRVPFMPGTWPIALVQYTPRALLSIGDPNHRVLPRANYHRPSNRNLITRTASLFSLPIPLVRVIIKEVQEERLVSKRFPSAHHPFPMQRYLLY